MSLLFWYLLNSPSLNSTTQASPLATTENTFFWLESSAVPYTWPVYKEPTDIVVEISFTSDFEKLFFVADLLFSADADHSVPVG